jgi:hypothetical protein
MILVSAFQVVIQICPFYFFCFIRFSRTSLSRVELFDSRYGTCNYLHLLFSDHLVPRCWHRLGFSRQSPDFSFTTYFYENTFIFLSLLETAFFSSDPPAFFTSLAAVSAFYSYRTNRHSQNDSFSYNINRGSHPRSKWNKRLGFAPIDLHKILLRF